jgi:hypothetical protein
VLPHQFLSPTPPILTAFLSSLLFYLYTIIFIDKMASKIDSSSIIAGSTQELTRSTKGRGIISLVWVYSRTALEGEDPNFRYCIPCSKEGAKKIYYTTAPTNFKNYLKLVHSILVKTIVSKI